MKIELASISKRFGSVLANDNISLTVEAGSIHGLLGENGAGKSTLVKILSGFIARDRGSILLNNIPVEIANPEAAIHHGIGMLHQDPLDFPALSVWENFTIGRLNAAGVKSTEVLTKNRTSVLTAKGKFLSKKVAVGELKELASQFNFNLDINEKVGNLSVGERQQLELLRLLSLGVQTLILDEPTTGISASQKDALFAAVKQLAAEVKSVIFVSHKLEDVDVLCDRATVMRQGRVAGNAEMPCPSSKLIEMMFDRELAQPNKPPTARSDVALNLHNITIKDDRLNIKIDNLEVQRGEVIGLAGLEGSGQRLLLLLCAGLLPASSGTMIVNGTNMTRKSYQEYLQAGVGILPADRLKEGLVSGLSIREHVALRSPSKSLFVNWKDTREMAQQAIAFFNIRGTPDSQVERLSGGNQQRTQLALLPVPLNLLLMEHPTRGLDIESSIWVWQQLIARCQTGTAILFASSDLDEIMQYSDRVIVFSGGNVSEAIDTAELTAAKLGRAIGGKLNL
ncbi:MAG: ATP-binding cassette domain-containing protein [Oscillatoriaceae cyanobacterium Prado104]|jgi:simple sugar transport system ATP-binding protein|nr:ATP-binding cassette domain-containing protein [Oscillatoriaceae cyanobacterium Prado104]